MSTTIDRDLELAWDRYHRLQAEVCAHPDRASSPWYQDRLRRRQQARATIRRLDVALYRMYHGQESES